MFVTKLALSNFAVRRARVALTITAVAMSVSLVVAVTSGYASLFEAAFKFLNQYMGSTDVLITRQNDPVGGVPWQVVEELRQDPDVKRADGRLEARFTIPVVSEEEELRRVQTIGIQRPEDTRSDKTAMESGAWFNGATGDDAVIDQSVAEMLKVRVGDKFKLTNVDRTLDLTVVGIVHKPAVLAVHMHTVYMPLETMEQFAGTEGKVSRVLVDLKGQTNSRAFETRWKTKLKAIDSQLLIRLTGDTRQQMDNNLQGIHLLSYLGGAVSMLAATFIVFSSLSMGVSERQRSLAMMRAVGAFKSQIAALVIFEGLVLAAMGLALGVPLGWLWITLLATWFSKIFTAGVVMSWGGIAFGTTGTLVAAIAASALPAWSASRVSALEAMSPLSNASSGDGPPLRSALAGLVLISIDPFLFFGPLVKIAEALGAADPVIAARQVKFYLHFGIGLPAVMLGFFLLAPLFVWITERAAGPLVAALFGLRFALLRQQLSTGIWRAAGTAAALMVGLAVLIVMQTSGHTLLAGWKLPDKFPDVFIYSNGLDAQQQLKLAATPGIKELMPVTIASPEYGSNALGIGLAAIMPNATMFIGVDPEKALRMMELDFRDGNVRDAERMLYEGDHILITEEFHQLKGLKTGDTLPLKTTRGVVNFKIAGVIWSPGIDVMVSMYDMGSQFDQRTANSVFGSLKDGEKYFGINRAYLFAANLDYFFEREQLVKRVQKELGEQGLKVGDVREIKQRIETGFYQLLYLLSTVAFSAMAVASLGVTNTIMAGIRTRQWQFGILRSIGVTRSQLLRLVLAEAMLLGLIGCALGLACGFLMSADANALSAAVTGYRPPTVIPWNFIFIGLGAVLVISVGASIWPAVNVARTEPLTLLQAGRAAA